MDSGRLETLQGSVHLDTVRALHQTVVSLRTALEVSKNELKELKQKYQQHSQCIDHADVIEKLTIENHILRRKIIDTDFLEKDSSAQNIKLEVTYSPRSRKEESDSEIVIRTATTDNQEVIKNIEPVTQSEDNFCSTFEDNNNITVESSRREKSIEKLSPPSNNSNAENYSPRNSAPENVSAENTDIDVQSQLSAPESEVETKFPTSFQTKLELLSKFDVRIKVRTLKEGSVISTTTSETDSSINTAEHFEERQEHTNLDSNESVIKFKSVSSENIKMAVPNEAEAKSKNDKFNVKVRITSEENLLVKENVDRVKTKDPFNLDVDDLSLRSLSDGDNSVFSEGVTPLDHQRDEKEENASGNESEEVDDIELIFTTDESKDMSNLQEDLVPIRETDHWTPTSASTHSTPVLIKFHTLDPDFQLGENENQENQTSLQAKRVSLPNDKEIKHVAFNKLNEPRGILKSCDNKSDNVLYKRSPNTSYGRLNSADSLTCDYNRLSFDNTKSSSFEMGSSMDVLTREESVDSFHRNCYLGHRFSVFAETDISKCGTSEDDLAGNLHVRRNTCPNPFQYRPPYRVSRPPGPFLPATAVRLARDSCVPRRDSAAQTNMSALPNWGSDGYLAYKSPAPQPPPPSVPSRVTSRRPTIHSANLNQHCDEARRVMLSDIGFTSMVPELSRSADPVWALGNLADTSSTSNSTSKFVSRGSSYRSPCVSIDRSSDMLPHAAYARHTKVDYRRWRCSLPDVRRDDTEELLHEAEVFVRRSTDNLHAVADVDKSYEQVPMLGQPYIPSEPRQLRLGHTVKLITPHGRLAVGRVRYVGLAGGTAASSSMVVGAEFPLLQNQSLPRNDGTYRGRRYFLTPPQFVALFVPFNKVVMAWTN